MLNFSRGVQNNLSVEIPLPFDALHLGVTTTHGVAYDGEKKIILDVFPK